MSKSISITVLKDQEDQIVHRARRYKIHPTREALLIFFISFILITTNTLFIYDRALESKKQELGNGLVRSAKIIAAGIDGDLHKTFLTPSQESSAEYLKAIEPLVHAREANEDTFKYIYTMILKDGVPHIVLDGSPVNEKSNIMEKYDTDELTLLDALTNQKAQAMPEPKKDDLGWGVVISAYAPFKDSEGNFVGIVGVDMTDETYHERLYPILRATIRTIVTGFFISFLMAAFVWFSRNFSRVLNGKRWSLLRHLEKEKRYHSEQVDMSD